MPIYEYQCLGCKGQFQSLVMKNEEEAHLNCPECGGKRLKKLLDPAQLTKGGIQGL